MAHGCAYYTAVSAIIISAFRRFSYLLQILITWHLQLWKNAFRILDLFWETSCHLQICEWKGVAKAVFDWNALWYMPKVYLSQANRYNHAFENTIKIKNRFYPKWFWNEWKYILEFLIFYIFFELQHVLQMLESL